MAIAYLVLMDKDQNNSDIKTMNESFYVITLILGFCMVVYHAHLASKEHLTKLFGK